MKLVTYKFGSFISCGVLTEKGIVDVPTEWGSSNPPSSVKQILERGGECIEKAGELAKSAKNIMPLDKVKLLAPIPRPGKVLALAGNYSEHIKEAGLALGLSDSPRKTTVPRPFLMPATAVAGPDAVIEWPGYSEQIDYEIELAIVIGKKCKNISEESALDFVAGYCIANDISARSVTFKKNRDERGWDEFYDWLNGKWADGFMPMGPYLLTADEIGDAQNLDMQLTVNGKVLQKANTSQMIFGAAEVVSFVSHLVTLEAGDVISTGTPSGVGMATGKFLQEGDLIECKIEKLGSLKNRMGDKPGRFYEPLGK